MMTVRWYRSGTSAQRVPGVPMRRSPCGKQPLAVIDESTPRLMTWKVSLLEGTKSRLQLRGINGNLHRFEKWMKLVLYSSLLRNLKLTPPRKFCEPRQCAYQSERLPAAPRHPPEPLRVFVVPFSILVKSIQDA